LSESFQENLLGRFFNQAALAKEPAGDLEYPRAIAPDYLGKGGLVFRAGLTRQLEVGRLFVTVGQKRSSSKLRLAGPV
jgi:hypothetical protein